MHARATLTTGATPCPGRPLDILLSLGTLQCQQQQQTARRVIRAGGLGALVGGGMLLGYGRTSTTAGIVAGGIALLMIICTKAVPATLIALGAGLLNSVAQTSNVSYDPNFARADLPWMMVDDVHAEAGRDFNDTTWDEDEAARVEAEALVADIPDEELELYWKRQHLAELRFTDARSISMDDLTSEVEDLPRVPYAEIQSDCNGMTLASLDAEIAAWQPPSSGITFGSAFAAMFSPWDILWSLLAVATAFKLAFGDGN
ncbi:MAG: hypothetical protein AAF561_12450 [Planctomycetota bacterium]